MINFSEWHNESIFQCIAFFIGMLMIIIGVVLLSYSHSSVDSLYPYTMKQSGGHIKLANVDLESDEERDVDPLIKSEKSIDNQVVNQEEIHEEIHEMKEEIKNQDEEKKEKPIEVKEEEKPNENV